MDNLQDLYSIDSRDALLTYLKIGGDTLDDRTSDKESARVAPQLYSEEAFRALVEAYATFPDVGGDAQAEIQRIVGDLLTGIPRWRSPLQQYNVGTAANRAASAMYALALDESILNINDGTSGNTLVAEQAVTQMMGAMAGLSRPYGIFTFGGTATNMYGIKLGLKKAWPRSSKSGAPNRTKVFITAEAHFSHLAAADWLGIGVDNVVRIKAQRDRSSDLHDLEAQLRATLEAGEAIGAIVINGGTTYDHIIDDIPAVVALRDQLVAMYGLAYKPHIHVDTVIGWGWLVFAEYDWRANPLHIAPKALQKLRNQYNRIKHVKMADSWGIDFHKGIGGCPVDCSMVVINSFEEAMMLSRKHTGADIHQLAEQYSFVSPVDYTLETSRSSGAPLAALAAIRTLGKDGYRRILANLVEQTGYARERLACLPSMQIANDKSQGFTLMLRLLPPEFPGVTLQDELDDVSAVSEERSRLISAYNKAFFEWDFSTRLHEGHGPEYSFSRSYFVSPNGVELSALKFYPVSPHYSRHHAAQLVDTMIKQQRKFNDTQWQK